MRFLFTCFLLILLGNLSSAADTASAFRRIVLVGDAGKTEGNKIPVIESIRKTVTLDSNTTVIFLGDNVYSSQPDDAELGKVLGLQADIVLNTSATAIFLPGHSDWDYGKREGFDAILKQQAFIKSLRKKNVKFYPEDGCPGPVDMDISDDVVMLFMDTQWWLHKFDKPGIESDCKYKTTTQVIDELKDAIGDDPDKLIILAAHHPLKSTGMHSGHYGLKQHVFPFTDINALRHFYLPLPIVGSLYPFGKALFTGRQDMKHEDYAAMTKAIENATSDHPFLIRVGGHDHSLQLHTNEGNYIVSGAGSDARRANTTKHVPYAKHSLGFTVLEVYPNKTVKAIFYEVKDGQTTVGYSKNILDFSAPPPLAEDTSTVFVPVGKDSVTVQANKYYTKTPGLARLFLGDNYRQEWATPVKLKVFNLNEEKGGLKITGTGGGKQTLSLDLVDDAGKKWKLRSINKDPKKAIPENLRGTFARDIVQDMISAANPYAPLAVSGLAKAVGVPTPELDFFFIPNDSALGLHRPAFANTVAMLEEKEPTLYKEETKNTWDVVNKMVEESDRYIDQNAFLKARLLDILIADFDRHYDQWSWGVKDSSIGTVYYPIPKDRDQAFFYSEGLLVKMASTRRLPFLKGLRHNIPKLKWMGYPSRDIDAAFLNELDRRTWQATISQFKDNLPDDVIDAAVKSLPPEIYPLHGPATAAKLKSRRDFLSKHGLDYYEFLSKKVTVLGTNKEELFLVSGKGDDMLVEMYNKSGDSLGQLKYSRLFNTNDTREIRLYGLNSNDSFVIKESTPGGIKFRIVGGKGDDTYNINGRARNFIYDDKSGNNYIIARRRTINMISRQPGVNEYNFREETYNNVQIPKLRLGYNVEDGFMAGVGFSIQTRGFRKEPYATNQELSSLFSFTHRAFQLKYFAEFNQIIRHYDVVLDGALVNPTLNNFFGFGNDTKLNSSRGNPFYRVRYSYLSGDVLLRRRLFRNKLSIGAGPSLFHYWNKQEKNIDKVLFDPDIIGLDSTSVYQTKVYAGGKAHINYNTLNNHLLPTRGVNFTTEFSSLTALNVSSFPITRLTSSISVFAPLNQKEKFIAVLHLGGGHIFSKNFEYFQALTLGANNYMRGYRKNRFSGSSMFYGSVELRMKLLETQSYILPGDLGLIGFNDLGRVWMKNQDSDKWHHSYGGGLYYTPFDLLMISTTVGLSEEGTLFNIGLGTKLNIVF